MTRSLLLAAALLSAAPALAQAVGSESHQFLEAVRDAKGEDVQRFVETPGSRIIDTRDVTSGEGALHIVAKRGDGTYLRYLLQHGADPNLRDGRGNTALMLAVTGNHGELIHDLVAAHANVNVANASGETPLIRAVQMRDLNMVRELLNAGANADQRDRLAGLSAREYAARDTRTPALLKIIDQKPEKPTVAVSGPKL